MDLKDLREMYPQARIWSRPCPRCGRALHLVDSRTDLWPYLEAVPCECGWIWRGPWSARWREAGIFLLRLPREIARRRERFMGELRALACQAWGHRWEMEGGRSCPKGMEFEGYS